MNRTKQENDKRLQILERLGFSFEVVDEYTHNRLNGPFRILFMLKDIPTEDLEMILPVMLFDAGVFIGKIKKEKDIQEVLGLYTGDWTYDTIYVFKDRIYNEKYKK